MLYHISKHLLIHIFFYIFSIISFSHLIYLKEEEGQRRLYTYHYISKIN